MGHNEVDEPSFTQPLMYNVIKKTMPIMRQYTQKLLNENLVTEEQVKVGTYENFKSIVMNGNNWPTGNRYFWILQRVVDEYNEMCESAYHRSINETHHAHYKYWNDSPRFDYFEGKNPLQMSSTGVREDTLEYIGKQFSSPPPAETKFTIHKGQYVRRYTPNSGKIFSSSTHAWNDERGIDFDY